jgi:hypothetical protein
LNRTALRSFARCRGVQLGGATTAATTATLFGSLRALLPALRPGRQPPDLALRLELERWTGTAR